MRAIFLDSGGNPIQAAFVQFEIGTGAVHREENSIASFYLHLVGEGVTPDQALAISRAGQGVLLARQEAREADAKATAAQEENTRQDDRLEALESAPPGAAGATPAQVAAIEANTAKVGITPAQAQAITDNSAKVGITQAQANAITANTNARWEGSAYTVPHEIPTDQTAFTLRAFLDRADGTFPAGARMRINASGRKALRVNAVWSVGISWGTV